MLAARWSRGLDGKEGLARECGGAWHAYMFCVCETPDGNWAVRRGCVSAETARQMST